MRLAEIFEDVTPCALCLGGECLEWRSRPGEAVEIGDDERIQGPSDGPRCADRLQRCRRAVNRGLVGGHELSRAGHTGQRHRFPTGMPDIVAKPTMAIT